jgi:hypothetical protein
MNRNKGSTTGLGEEIPPDETHVRVYFLQQGATEKQAAAFYRHYKERLWNNSRAETLKNWKRLAWTWIWYRYKL